MWHSLHINSLNVLSLHFKGHIFNILPSSQKYVLAFFPSSLLRYNCHTALCKFKVQSHFAMEEAIRWLQEAFIGYIKFTLSINGGYRG